MRPASSGKRALAGPRSSTGLSAPCGAAGSHGFPNRRPDRFGPWTATRICPGLVRATPAASAAPACARPIAAFVRMAPPPADAYRGILTLRSENSPARRRYGKRCSSPASDFRQLPDVGGNLAMLPDEIGILGDPQRGRGGGNGAQETRRPPTGAALGAVLDEIAEYRLRRGRVEARVLPEMLVEFRHHLAPRALGQEAGRIGHVAGRAFRLPYRRRIGRRAVAFPFALPLPGRKPTGRRRMRH